MQNEIWVNIKEADNFQVSNLGRIRRAKYQMIDKNGHKRTFFEKIITGYIENHGYVSHNIGGYRDLEHRIVGNYFVENPNNYPEINHINGVKTDNRAENLEWSTSRQNKEHAWKHLENGMIYKKMSESNEKIRAIFRLKGIKKSDLAKHLGLTSAAIYSYLRKDIFERERKVADFLGVHIEDLIDDVNTTFETVENQTLGGKVWNARMVLGMKRSDLAKKCGCSSEYIRLIEANKQKPSIKFSLLISKELKIYIKHFEKS